MSTEKENYQELWLKYYNIVFDIIKTHKNMKNDWDSSIFLSPYAQFGCNVERILKNNDLID